MMGRELKRLTDLHIQSCKQSQGVEDRSLNSVKNIELRIYEDYSRR